jgi:hypothetical protein
MLAYSKPLFVLEITFEILKEVWHEIFYFRFFMNQFPLAFE